MSTVIGLYRQFYEETGDPVAASNLVLAHAMLNPQVEETKALKVSEAAKRLRISDKKVYQFCEEGRLRHHRIGNSIRIRPEDIEEFIQESEGPKESNRPHRRRYRHLRL